MSKFQKGFDPRRGMSPGRRPGMTRAVKELVGEEGQEIVQLQFSIMKGDPQPGRVLNEMDVNAYKQALANLPKRKRGEPAPATPAVVEVRDLLVPSIDQRQKAAEFLAHYGFGKPVQPVEQDVTVREATFTPADARKLTDAQLDAIIALSGGAEDDSLPDGAGDAGGSDPGSDGGEVP